MYRKAFLIAASAMLANPAVAQTAAPAPAASAAHGVAAGAIVYDAQGDVVGTIVSTDGTNAVVDTGTVKAALALSAFGTSPKGPTLGMTKAQLDAAASQQQPNSAEFRAKLVPGAAVYGSGGTEIGKIKEADAQFITLTTPHGDARLPIAGFGPGTNGITIGLTAQQLEAAIKGAAPQK
ncbi:hypothetical protein [uncultured Sphingomonas sp.]|uniref:hypothetical protein n=1 Tax=uncultured Sphingomonas sp. TaxID=158754 RepID=UPI002621FA76|nr:hypothetical protein [uncultured Sphingomonas sp.]